MSIRHVGVDPGCSGAIVALDGALVPVEWERMPTVKTGKANRVNAALLSSRLRDWLTDTTEAVVFIELVHSMRGQGVSTTFTFGHACGSVSGVCGALFIPMTYVTPQAWKKTAGLIGKDKDAARSRAIELWPSWRALDKKGAGQAYADAALIARHGALKHR